MSAPLEMRVLDAVGAGHRTLEALATALGAPAAAVDDKIRWAIGERLLVPYRHGDTWTFELTDTGQRMLAMRSRLDEVAPGPSGGVAATGPGRAVRPGGGLGGAPGLASVGGPGSLAGVARSLFELISGGASSSSRGAAPPSAEAAAPSTSARPSSSPVASSSGASHLLSPTEEAQRAERAAWWFAVSVVGAVVAVGLIVWVLATV